MDRLTGNYDVTYRACTMRLDIANSTNITPPADLLMTNWATGKSAAIDISVTSPLNTHNLMEVGGYDN